MSSVDDTGQYGLASGVGPDDREPGRFHPCPDCGRGLTGGPTVFWCAAGHTFHGASLDMDYPTRVARQAAARAHELELERATHVPEYRSRVTR